MTKTVRNEIKKIVKKTGIPEDYLEECAEEVYNIGWDGKKASSQFIINGLWSEAELFLETCDPEKAEELF